jgi:hypothetical protein
MNSASTALYTRVPVKNRVRILRRRAGLGRNGHDGSSILTGQSA